LFTVAGGIVVRGSLAATPGANVLLLLVATLIASWVGTTGASMLLIHPLLRANQRRRYRVHTVVFFIFLASNVGGALTPLGDPPLFLGFLSGVPFFWTLHLIPHLAVLAAMLLLTYYIVERRAYAKDVAEQAGGAAVFGRGDDPLRLAGRRNLPLLLGIVSVVLFSGTVQWRSVPVLGVHVPLQNLLRDGLLLAIGLASLWTTPRAFRAENQFTWAPMREVAYLFAGIFMTIIPALAILQAGEAGALGFLVRAVERPADYYWATGLLSAFLDNAPTYLTFLNTALGKYFTGVETHAAVARLIAEEVRILAAISAGAVFFGAATYIGNAPNFMVRAIAEERGVRMPSFFGFILRWSVPFLLPGLLLVALLFFR
jgi:Na+/H+ antiporter NhaD/arsenite permease-like protein